MTPRRVPTRGLRNRAVSSPLAAAFCATLLAAAAVGAPADRIEPLARGETALLSDAAWIPASPTAVREVLIEETSGKPATVEISRVGRRGASGATLTLPIFAIERLTIDVQSAFPEVSSGSFALRVSVTAGEGSIRFAAVSQSPESRASVLSGLLSFNGAAGAITLKAGSNLAITPGSDNTFVLSSTATPGPVGPDGPSGPQGPAGIQGALGPAGPSGAAGSTGPAGLQGPAGPTGPMGTAGSQGAAGAAGPTGPAGAQGPAGQPGPMGNDGFPGLIGLAGGQGPAGSQGVVGVMGAPGSQGSIGPVGPSATFSTGGQPGTLDNSLSAIATLTLPAGSYLIRASVSAHNTGGSNSTLLCDLGGGVGGSRRVRVTGDTTLTLQTVRTISGSPTVTLMCGSIGPFLTSGPISLMALTLDTVSAE